jgi:purine-binding chemotaxis protein CheW
MPLEPSDTLLVFTLSEQRCALALSDIERIVRIVEINPLPKAPEIVLGLINVQGRAVPVLNIRKLFNLPEVVITLSDQMIIARTSHRTVAILVDNAVGVVDCKQEDITPAEELFPGIGYLKGVAKLKDGIAYIYDLDSFLSLDEEAMLDRVLTPGVNISEVDRHNA